MFYYGVFNRWEENSSQEMAKVPAVAPGPQTILSKALNHLKETEASKPKR